MDIFSYLNDKNKIYNMDAFDLMKQLPDTSVQLILTDPP